MTEKYRSNTYTKSNITDMEKMNLTDGTLLQGGKYKIVRFIGSGGFGNTYEAEHTMLHSRVAVKEFFVKDFCNRDETTEQVTVGTNTKKGLVDKLKEKFVEEAQAISQLQHPNIVRVTDVFEENGTAYYVMDYIDGLSLDEIVKYNGPLPEKEAIWYIKQIANALAYVHSQNRLHLDVKPGNIISDGNGNVFLIDFGASKQYDEVDGENTSTLMGRTPGYAPIEQIGNDVVRFTPATDIYALGATLYKFVTGITPIGANMLASGEELAPLPSNISRNVANAIYAAMRTNRRERPQSIAEFLSILNSNKGSVTELGYNNNSKDMTVLDFGGKNSTLVSTTLTNKNPEYRPKDQEPKHSKNTGSRRTVVGIIVGCVLAIVIAVIVGIVLLRATPPKIIGTSTVGQVNGYKYVDLGLSVKWAAYNVGATSPSDYGNYYAWGETRTKSQYSRDNSVTYGRKMGDISGKTRYDAARACWGSPWRLPTKAEIDELIEECGWEWTMQGGHYGCKVTGPNGNSIFLPAAGIGGDYYLGQGGGYYWSSSPEIYDDDDIFAYHISFFLSATSKSVGDFRDNGESVRPVFN